MLRTATVLRVEDRESKRLTPVQYAIVRDEIGIIHDLRNYTDTGRVFVQTGQQGVLEYTDVGNGCLWIFHPERGA